MVGGLVYYGAAALLLKLKVDDPLSAWPVHGACGVWGCLSVGIFADARNICRAYGSCSNVVSGGRQFVVQLGGTAAIVAWTCVTCGVMFAAMAKAGILRVSERDEAMGLDWTEHGGESHGATAASFMLAQQMKISDPEGAGAEGSMPDNEPANEPANP